MAFFHHHGSSATSNLSLSYILRQKSIRLLFPVLRQHGLRRLRRAALPLPALQAGLWGEAARQEQVRGEAAAQQRVKKQKNIVLLFLYSCQFTTISLCSIADTLADWTYSTLKKEKIHTQYGTRR